jgi:hypothetical protein
VVISLVHLPPFHCRHINSSNTMDVHFNFREKNSPKENLCYFYFMTPHVISKTFVELIYYFLQSRILQIRSTRRMPESLWRMPFSGLLRLSGLTCGNLFFFLYFNFLILKIYICLASCFLNSPFPASFCFRYCPPRHYECIDIELRNHSLL